jgi:tRNA U34 5-methylaminomethyl-2-thiouridine-forming methyltransferase MnmC
MTSTWTPHRTDDGSFTFFSEEFGETFHSQLGAKQEAFLKFAAATDLAEKAKGDQIRLLDVCYGLGYNTAAALETIWAIHPSCRIELYGLERDASVPQAAVEPPLVNTWSETVQAVLKALAATHQCQSARLSATLLIGDARQTIQQLQGFQADAVFFDPFSPRRCPQLWTVEFFRAVAGCLAATGKLATYSRSASVRSALKAAGFQIGTIPLSHNSTHLPHEWSQGTVAGFDAQALIPLSMMEQEHLQTRAAIPYHDPTLTDSAEAILERHQLQQQQSDCESTSSWRRRWGIR